MMAKLKQIIDTLEKVYNVCKRQRQEDVDVLNISNSKIIVSFKDEFGFIEADIEDGERDNDSEQDENNQ